MQAIMRMLLGAVPWSWRVQIKRVPGLAAAQRALVSRTLDGREFEHRVDAGPAKGVTFFLRMPEDKAIWTGAYEADFATRLAAAVRPGSVAYDIGSWHGFFAGVMAAQGAGQVHVFEPLPQNAARLRSFITLNPSKTIELHQCAIGVSDGEADLVVMPESSMAKLESSPFQPGEVSNTRLRVQVRSIDSIVAASEAPAPSLVKIDVEGAEAMVLEGARNTLRRHRPAIFAEIHCESLVGECRKLLEAEGYRIERLSGDSGSSQTADICHIAAFPVRAW